MAAAPDKVTNTLRKTSLHDKYTVLNDRVFMNGTQALVRLPMLQRLRDQKAELNTAGFVSGYRGSPLGNVDHEFWRAQKHLEPLNIHFQAGINEDLAATAVWGTQQVTLDPKATVDGVFAMWYAKGPGVDRSGDVLRHANAAGTSEHGGVLVIAGDDHAAKSSTLPHQTEHIFKAVMMPVLAPSDIQEYLDLGLHGFAMSRYSGCWIAFKALADTVETSASVNIDPFAVETIIPTDIPLPETGLSLRWPDPPKEQEVRLLEHKLYAAMRYCRVNKLNKIIFDSPKPRLGIVTSGKSYLDVRQALDELGIDESVASEIGLRVYKVAMVWPLEAKGIREFAEGLEEVLVVEEKRQFIEYQLKEILYNWQDDVRPRVIGKFNDKSEWSFPHDDWLLPAAGELTPAMIARVIAARISNYYSSDLVDSRLTFLDRKEAALAVPTRKAERIPHFCSGCPHNTSTKVPEGSRAMAGIGCHYMATWISSETTKTFTQMGGEGVPWVGQAPFTDTKHIFANLGDGTYFHSGLLAIRQAIAAGVNITYKVLYNDAVAMTGGQPHDGALSVPLISQQLRSEGIQKIIVVTDEPDKFSGHSGLADDVPVAHRSELDKIQREMREVPGVSALIYDQTCAAEKRRRRKRGQMPDPAKRVIINDLVCEGCGDCSEKSNCMSVTPIETEFGRKRTIDQSSCNKDFSCINGFCPSFVTVEGGSLRKPQRVDTATDLFENLPTPSLPDADKPWAILLTGVGGTGVVTIGALLGMAAHIEKKGVSVLDMAGLAQKGGAVWSHIRIANNPDNLFAAKIAAGEANAVIGCDLVVAAGDDSIAKMRSNFTQTAINTYQSVTSDFIHASSKQSQTGDVTTNPDTHFPINAMKQRVIDAAGEPSSTFINATKLATSIMGDAISTNLFMLGLSWQKGLIPLSLESLMSAIELNGTAVEANVLAFKWGRLAAVEPGRVEDYAKPKQGIPSHHKLSLTVDELIDRRKEQLTQYQNSAYANRYNELVNEVRAAEIELASNGTQLTEAVAKSYYKLLAYKDEYEVARLFTQSDFLKRVADQFEGDYTLNFHFAPPLFAAKDKENGQLKKRKYGPWMLKAMATLAKFKSLRGTPLDVFKNTDDRKLDRQWITDYEVMIKHILTDINEDNLQTAVELAALPEQLRGFGHIRERHSSQVKARKEHLMNIFDGKKPQPGVYKIPLDKVV